MTPLGLLGLLGLALVDSTSIGTLVLPIVFLLAPRVNVGHYVAYLATVVVLYAAIGLALVAGAGAALEAATALGDVRWLRWAQLVLGGVMLAGGIVGDGSWLRRVRKKERTTVGRSATATATDAGADGDRAPGADRQRRSGWRARLVGPRATYGAVIGVALVAVTLEVGTMLPFLGAVGIVTAADLPVAGWVGLVLLYNLVMVAPAALLLAARLALGARLGAPLQRLSDWLDRQTGNAIYIALVVIGLLLLQDARVALGLA